jgi:hypothetical protein
MVSDKNIAALLRRNRPGSVHSAGQEKNRSHQIATEKAKGPIAR